MVRTLLPFLTDRRHLLLLVRAFAGHLYERAYFAPYDSDQGELPGGLDFNDLATSLAWEASEEQRDMLLDGLIETDAEILDSILDYLRQLCEVATPTPCGPSPN